MGCHIKSFFSPVQGQKGATGRTGDTGDRGAPVRD